MSRDGSSRKGRAPVSCCAFGLLPTGESFLGRKTMWEVPGDLGLVIGMLIIFGSLYWMERDARRSLARSRAGARGRVVAGLPHNGVAGDGQQER